MNKIESTKQLLKQQYLQDDRPWVVTFSGGKDSSTVLHLTVEVLLELKKEKKDTKTIYIVSSDTRVEMPLIDKYFFEKIEEIKSFINKEQLNMQVAVVTPDAKDSFWSLLMGKGYPSPNQNFRWCTDKLKIKPATKFLTSLSSENKSIIMLLGVRSNESQTRQKAVVPFKMATRKELFRDLLKIEQDLSSNLEGKYLINDEDIIQIQKEWLHDGDFFESAINIANEYGRNIRHESKKSFSKNEKNYFSSLCKNNKLYQNHKIA